MHIYAGTMLALLSTFGGKKLKATFAPYYMFLFMLKLNVFAMSRVQINENIKKIILITVKYIKIIMALMAVQY